MVAVAGEERWERIEMGENRDGLGIYYFNILDGKIKVEIFVCCKMI